MTVPKHIGIIMDGNRRFAKRLVLKPLKGHEWGAKKIEKILEWCQEVKIEELTLYALSVENLDRPKEELEFLFDLFRKEFDRMKDDERISNNKIKINFIGRLNLLPQDVQARCKNLMKQTE